MADHGPYTADVVGQHPGLLSVGLIGTDETIQGFSAWLQSCRERIPADEEQANLHPEFPGFSSSSPFQSDVVQDDEWRETLTTRDMDSLLGMPNARDRFEYAVNLVVDAIEHIANRDTPPRVIVLALPKEIIQYCWSINTSGAQVPKRSPLERRMLRRQREDQRTGQGSLLDILAPEVEQTLAYRNFRRAVKARAMRHNVPIQLVQPHSWAVDKTPQPKPTIAWNFFTALYYKAGGFPWVLDAFHPGECFVGISFHRYVSDRTSGMYSSLAQLFSNRSEGLVLRGDRFEWDERLGRSPHLNRADAAALASKVVREYEREHHRKPKRVILHKSTVYWPDELQGFKDGLEGVADYDFVSVARQGMRLFREGQYPPVRGTHAHIAEKVHVLYTMGYIPALEGYPRGYVPDPLVITEHHGRSSGSRICNELMALSKMNWNSADFAAAEPITLKFAKRVGEIMSEIPADQEPKPQFKFYM